MQFALWKTYLYEVLCQIVNCISSLMPSVMFFRLMLVGGGGLEVERIQQGWAACNKNASLCACGSTANKLQQSTCPFKGMHPLLGCLPTQT